MNRALAEKEVKAIERKLDERDEYKFIQSRDWPKNYEKDAGVYLVLKRGKPIYVGESGNLRERMKDLLDTRNHSLRRRLGKELYHRKASTKKKFSQKIEEKLDGWMNNFLSVKTLPLFWGRKEFEEIYIQSHKYLLNKASRRKPK